MAKRRRILFALAFAGFALPPILMLYSHYRDTTLTFFTKHGGLYFNSGRGMFEAGYVDDSNGELRSGVHFYSKPPVPGFLNLNRIAITWPNDHFTLELPWRIIWMVTGAPGLILWIRRKLRSILKAIAESRRRNHVASQKNNICPVCGYDLRASPNRCPECGTWRED